MSLSFVIAILIGFLFSALFSGLETGSYMINRIRLRHRELERRPSAVILAGLLRNSHIFVFTVLIGNNIAIYLLSRSVTGLYLDSGLAGGVLLFGFFPWNAEMAATLTLILPLFVFAEIGPKNLFRKKADTLMYRLARMIRLLVLLFYPITWLLKQCFRLLTHGMEEEPCCELHRLSPAGLKEYFSAGEKEGVLSSYQSRMMDNVTSMHNIPVRMLMMPLKTISRLSSDSTVADFRRLCARRKAIYALLMSRHQVMGVVSVFEIVERGLDDDAELMPYAEEVLEIAESQSLKSAFYRLRRSSRHSAVVLDARKHPVGFIHLEDIARYIAGE